MFYIGITLLAGSAPISLPDGLKYENGIIYARKGTTAESLLIPSWELETIKGQIRRLPDEIYNSLNDDFGFHTLTAPIKPKPRLILKNKSV